MLAAFMHAVKTSLAQWALRRGNVAKADRLDNEIAADRYRQLLLRGFDGDAGSSEIVIAQVMAETYARTAKYALTRIHDGKTDHIERRLAVPGTEGFLSMATYDAVSPAIVEAHRAIEDHEDHQVVRAYFQFEKTNKTAPLVLRAYFSRREN